MSINTNVLYNQTNILPLYRLSTQYQTICVTLDCYNNLISKQEGYKIQLDSTEGQTLFKEYIEHVEQLVEMLNAKTIDRSYRQQFSKAYKVLFKEDELCYIPEILDSAQEGFPFLWVNGEKYTFSEEVLLKGQLLIESFYRVEQILRIFYTKIESYVYGIDLEQQKQCIKQILEEFDVHWTQFEKNYIRQLMKIEHQARSLMQEAIVAQAVLREYQQNQRTQGKIFFGGEQYHEKRRKLASLIAHLNSVANYEGKGRDDLGYNILQEAQATIKKVTSNESKAVRQLALKIRESFENLREIFRKYQINLELIDPQLKNNTDLVEGLMKYQRYWEKGNRYFLDDTKMRQLLLFSEFVETTEEKYESFKQMLECNDPNIFLIIPSLIILKSLENEDSGLTESFLHDLNKPESKHYAQYETLKHLYCNWKNSFTKGYLYYNLIEQSLIGTKNTQYKEVSEIENQIKILAMELERVNPVEWNNLLNAILISDEE